MKGIVTVCVKKRRVTSSKLFMDKFAFLDVVRLVGYGPHHFVTISKKGAPKAIIPKDELAFVRYVFDFYGPGDFAIALFGKRNYKGFRRFWDGLIMPEGRFYRRKSNRPDQQVSLFDKHYRARDPECYITRFMKTKPAGVWHSF